MSRRFRTKTRPESHAPLHQRREKPPGARPWDSDDLHDQSTNLPEELDTAIVGGGPAGIYCAWRLVNDRTYDGGSLGVFEATNRIGGRVNSIIMKPLPYVADIGAMRYCSTQVIMSSLVLHLGLDIYPHMFPTTTYFLRGRHILPLWDKQNLKEVRSEAGKREVVEQSAYKLDPADAGLGPDHFLREALSRALSKIDMDNDASKDEDPSVLAACAAVASKLTSAAHRGDLNFATLSPYEWSMVKKRGVYRRGRRPLTEVGLWDLIQAELGAEAFALARDALGYQTIIGTWNAAEHIPWFLSEFGDVKYFEVKGGLSQVIDRLYVDTGDRIREHRGSIGENFVYRKRRLTGLARDDNRILLRFNGGSERSEGEQVSAKRVILALPQVAVEQLEITDMTLNAELAADVAKPTLSEVSRCVSPNPLFKAFAFYGSPWWWTGLSGLDRQRIAEQCRCTLAPHGRYGMAMDLATLRIEDRRILAETGEFGTAKVLTDLPVRQLYFHGPGSAALVQPSGLDHCGGMIMVYCDAREVGYWSSLGQVGGGKRYCDDELYRMLAETGASNRVAAYGVSEPFEEAFTRCLKWIFRDVIGAERVPRPSTIIFENWNRDPFYGGWHAWNVGCKPWSVRRRLARPFKDAAVYICGEAFSAEQGWCEGAWRSCERVLMGHLHLEEPDWKGFREAIAGSPYRNFREYVSW